MIDEDLKGRLTDAISGDQYLSTGSQVLADFKSSGGTQQVALDTLEAMRDGASEEFEDRILEIMDFASGWCQPQYRIW